MATVICSRTVTACLRAIRRNAASALLALLLWLVAAPAFAQSDAEFLAAKNAFEHGDVAKLDALATGLKGHLLAPYVMYWQIKLRIDDVDYDSVRAFLTQYPDTPLAHRLTIDWLKTAAKRGDWTRFALDYPPVAGEDIELTCYGIHFRQQRDGDTALAAAKPLWFTGQSTPDACEPLFTALLAKGELTNADRQLRFRLATEAGNVRLAQALATDPSARERIPLSELMAIERDPVRALAKGAFAWKTPAGHDLALYALERIARKDADVAHAAWIKWRERLPKALREYGNARVAYHAARQLRPRANEWFREVGNTPLAPEQQSWRVRAALRALAWRDVRAAIDALPDDEQQDPAWRFWKARALSELGAKEEAGGLYATVASGVNFYSILAAEALGRGPEQLASLKSEPSKATDDALAAFAAKPAVKRAVKLAALDMRAESRREWIAVVAGQDDEGLLLAADYARRVGLYDRAINTAERTLARHDYTMRYMTPWRLEFGAAARDQSIDEELLYAIARQESRFAADIVSSAGAIGVMQLMPGTARWVAKQLARTDYNAGRIAEVDLNTQFGAYYFKYWHDRLDRMPALAAAAYNAGPSRAQAWRPVAAPLEGAIWVETIPFNETRDYVKKVLANAMLYANALNRPYVPLSVRLGTITPRGATAVLTQAE
ncbi:MAG TPA: transglycosylase SLT domain-containing protein [Casimicrobiaceae bacterium]